MVICSTEPGVSTRFSRPHGTVGVADHPEDERVAEILGGDEVEPVALHDDVLRDRREVLGAWLRHVAACEIGDVWPSGLRVLQRRGPVVAAVGGEGDRRHRAEGDQGLQRDSWS